MEATPGFAPFLVRWLSAFDWGAIAGLIVSTVSAAGTLAAVAVAVWTSSRATRLAESANAIAAAAIEAQRDVHAAEIAWRRGQARRTAGARLIVWLHDYFIFMDRMKRSAEGLGTYLPTDEDQKTVNVSTMIAEIEAAGHPRINELVSFAAVWIHNMPVSTETAEELFAAFERADKLTWQFRAAVDDWEQNPDPDATLLRAFRDLDPVAEARFPTAGPWNWENQPPPER